MSFGLVMAIAPFILVIGILLIAIAYFEKTMKEDDLTDKIAVRVINILICFIIAWIVYGAYYLYKI